MQTYDLPNTSLWHADLYRLADSSELVELGLDEAFGSEIVLLEWPDRLPTELWPENALEIEIFPEADRRKVILNSSSERWRAILEGLADG